MEAESTSEKARKLKARLRASPPEAKVIAFGFERFLGERTVGLNFQREGLGVEFEHANSLQYLREYGAQVAVLPIELPAAKGTLQWTCRPDDYAATVQAVRLALGRGTAVCFLLTSETPHPYPVAAWSGKREYDGGADVHLYQTLPGYFLLRTMTQHTPRPLPLMCPLLTARRDEFRPFLDHFGAAAQELAPAKEGNVDVLAWAGENQRAAIACGVRRSYCIWLPTRLPRVSGVLDEWQELAWSIGQCVLTYVSRQTGDEPDWAKEYAFYGEQDIREREAEARRVLEEIQPDQARFAQLRRVIWTRDDPFRDAVVEFLRALGVDIEVKEQCVEDFWIREQGARMAIAETKALNSNVTPTGLSDIESHRSRQGLDDEFPALLVVRPFAAKPQVVDQQVEPNVRERAKTDNVVVMRALDLANLYNLIQEKKATVEEFLAQVKSGGGWLKIDREGMKKLVK